MKFLRIINLCLVLSALANSFPAFGMWGSVAPALKRAFGKAASEVASKIPASKVVTALSSDNRAPAVETPVAATLTAGVDPQHRRFFTRKLHFGLPPAPQFNSNGIDTKMYQSNDLFDNQMRKFGILVGTSPKQQKAATEDNESTHPSSNTPARTRIARATMTANATPSMTGTALHDLVRNTKKPESTEKTVETGTTRQAATTATGANFTSTTTTLERRRELGKSIPRPLAFQPVRTSAQFTPIAPAPKPALQQAASVSPVRTTVQPRVSTTQSLARQAAAPKTAQSTPSMNPNVVPHASARLAQSGRTAAATLQTQPKHAGKLAGVKPQPRIENEHVTTLVHVPQTHARTSSKIRSNVTLPHTNARAAFHTAAPKTSTQRGFHTSARAASTALVPYNSGGALARVERKIPATVRATHGGGSHGSGSNARSWGKKLCYAGAAAAGAAVLYTLARTEDDVLANFTPVDANIIKTTVKTLDTFIALIEYLNTLTQQSSDKQLAVLESPETQHSMVTMQTALEKAQLEGLIPVLIDAELVGSKAGFDNNPHAVRILTAPRQRAQLALEGAEHATAGSADMRLANVEDQNNLSTASNNADSSDISIIILGKKIRIGNRYYYVAAVRGDILKAITGKIYSLVNESQQPFCHMILAGSTQQQLQTVQDIAALFNMMARANNGALQGTITGSSRALTIVDCENASRKALPAPHTEEFHQNGGSAQADNASGAADNKIETPVPTQPSAQASENDAAPHAAPAYAFSGSHAAFGDTYAPMPRGTAAAPTESSDELESIQALFAAQPPVAQTVKMPRSRPGAVRKVDAAGKSASSRMRKQAKDNADRAAHAAGNAAPPHAHKDSVQPHGASRGLGAPNAAHAANNGAHDANVAGNVAPSHGRGAARDEGSAKDHKHENVAPRATARAARSYSHDSEFNNSRYAPEELAIRDHGDALLKALKANQRLNPEWAGTARATLGGFITAYNRLLDRSRTDRALQAVLKDDNTWIYNFINIIKRSNIPPARPLLPL